MRLATRRCDEVSQRLLLWTLVALFLTLLCYQSGLAIPRDLGDLFVGKLALLGLLAATATFQYAWWHSFAQRQQELVYEPAWVAEERRMQDQLARGAAGAAPADSEVIAREIRLARWHAWRAETTVGILNGVLPHNRVVLANLSAGGYLLIVSVTADFAKALLDPTSGIGTALSLGAFLTAVLTFLEVWVRYSLSLSYEFRAWEESFRAAAQESRQKADRGAEQGR